jgi:hypothetical protein
MKKTQINNKINNKIINKTNHVVNKYSKTIPINIPKKNNERDFLFSQEIKINLFDPDKYSPPSSWKTRLSLRVLNMQ